ncbi:MAG: DNA polymerase II, partial [Fibrobacterota bacterium]
MSAPKTRTSTDCFLLTTQSRDGENGFEITIWAVTRSGIPVKIVVNDFRPLFFCKRSLSSKETRSAQERKQLPLTSLHKEPVDCLYFSNHSEMQRTARHLRTQGHTVFESDIHPLERYLMERMVTGGMRVSGQQSQSGQVICYRNPHLRGCPLDPVLKTESFDIETCVSTGEIYSIASVGTGSAVFIRGDLADRDNIHFCRNERDLLTRFISYLKKSDPDVLIGWNVIEFDLRVIMKRCHSLGVPFDIGRDRGSRLVQSRNTGNWSARIPGRVVIDVPTMLRAYHHSFEEYSLDHVAAKILGRHKTIQQSGKEKIARIDHLFQNDKLALANYNLTDAQLTLDIFAKTGLLQNAIERSKRSGQSLERTGGSVAAIDYLYLPRLHRAGYVASDILDISPPEGPLPGGFVVEPQPGLYENVLVFDFKSLYPSIIMTFLIDPLGFRIKEDEQITNPTGTTFSRHNHILPEVISELMEARARAKKENNPYLSQAIKILMNSFYGVLGSTGCRFFSQEIASTITMTGRYILKTSIEQIEKFSGKKVIYGDTDSLFVHLGPDMNEEPGQIGSTISKQVTEWLKEHLKRSFSASSKLELQYENHFRHFFVPSLRNGGPNQGSKKHYCGSVYDESGAMRLVFKGMESARSDWTELAKEFQRELFLRFFAGKQLDDYVAHTVELLKGG